MKFPNTTSENIFYVDERWFSLFVKIKRPLLLNAFSFNLKEMENEKRKFMNSDNYIPEFIYKIDNLTNRSILAIMGLEDLRNKLLQEEVDLSIQEAYIQKIDEALLEQKIIIASRESDWGNFKIYNVERFGQISIDLISTRLRNIQKKFNLFTNIKFQEHNQTFIVSEKVLKRATGFFCTWPDLITTEKFNSQSVLNSTEVMDLWNNSLSEISKEWKVVVSDNVSHIKVSNKSQKIILPEKIILPLNKAMSLYAHEVGVHVYRRENGKNTILKLLSIGLAGYDRAEEGICLMREQVILGSVNLPSFDKYFALAYVVGAVDGHEKNFREAFTVLKEIFLKRMSKRFDLVDADKISSERAWNISMRVFRGGNPSVPGCCFYRDKIYREGNSMMWNLFENSPENFSYARFGKFDPSNVNHIKLLLRYKN